MEKEVEFKIKFKNEENIRWEDRPVLITAIGVENSKVKSFVRNNFVNQNIVEVRWNYVGSSQGHYIFMGES